MKTKLISILTLLAFCFIMGACEDQLDIMKKGNLGGEADFYKTDNDAIRAITAAYSDWNGLHGNLSMLLEMLSDDAWTGGPNRGDQVQFQYLNEYAFDSENTAIQDVFSALYTVIYDANLVIEKVTPDTDAKKRCIAEAYFFRGWANFYLGALWGTAPVVDHLLKPSEYAAGNSETGALYAQAASDLNTAIEMNALPSKTSIDDAGTGIRITQEAVYAFLGKTYLFNGKKAEAAAALDKIITSQKYGLYEGDYENILKPVSEFCRESVLECNAVKDQNVFSMDASGVWRGFRNDQFEWTGQKANYADIAKGYGFDNPRKNLYDAFKAHNAAGGGNDYRLEQSIKTYGFMKDEIGIFTIAGLHGNEGYFNWKMRFLNSEITISLSGFDVWVDINWRYMRYAEVLLLAAEANLETNNANALKYINEVRTRAKLNPLGSVTLNDIKKEKRFELCFEGARFLDLVRWGDAYEVLKDQGKQVMIFKTDETTAVEYTNAGSGFVQGKHEFLPFPAKERLVNPNINPNPGW
jgi:hypothetical protein